jgi:hypothetical protein
VGDGGESSPERGSGTRMKFYLSPCGDFVPEHFICFLNKLFSLTISLIENYINLILLITITIIIIIITIIIIIDGSPQELVVIQGDGDGEIILLKREIRMKMENILDGRD